jgi:hypothetical protein
MEPRQWTWSEHCSNHALKSAYSVLQSSVHVKKCTLHGLYSSDSFQRTYETLPFDFFASHRVLNYDNRLFGIKGLDEIDVMYRTQVSDYMDPLFSVSPVILFKTKDGYAILHAIGKCVAAFLDRSSIRALVISSV